MAGQNGIQKPDRFLDPHCITDFPVRMRTQDATLNRSNTYVNGDADGAVLTL